ncbi:hypothetical protein AB0D74_00580 [Streptomyces sp. NPDC048278]|uniref:hypothetical protein n=1 Tax=unclassified Streptomyces TaxID=2593676 RepID=UPI003432D166
MTGFRQRVRRALLLPVAVCALASCGIPTTGVVQAGGPASGVVPTARLYFVREGALVAVQRPTAAPGDVGAAVRDLLRGPTEAELSRGLTTRLPLITGTPTAVQAVPAYGGATAVPRTPSSADLVKVTVSGGRVSVRLSSAAGEPGDPGLAAGQLACTAAAARRTADPAGEPGPVTVTLPDGRRFEEAATRCPGG